MNRVLTVAIAAGALLATASANATTITTATQTITFGPGLTDYTNTAQSLALFDSNLGTLASVVISGTYGFQSTVTVTAASASGGSVRSESGSAFTSSAPSINSVIMALLDGIPSLTVGSKTLAPAAFDLLGFSAVYSLPNGGTQSGLVSNASTQTIGPVTDTTASDLAAFVALGGGEFDVLFNTITGTLLSSSGGNASASQTTTATGTVSIHYTYNTPVTPSVPEPASIALLGVGLLGTGLFRRYRNNLGRS